MTKAKSIACVVWAKVAADLDDQPKILRAGGSASPAGAVYQYVLRRVAEHGSTGAIDAALVEPWYVARRTGLTEGAAAQALETCLAELLPGRGPLLLRDGDIVRVADWDPETMGRGAPKTDAERAEAYRKRKKQRGEGEEERHESRDGVTERDGRDERDAGLGLPSEEEDQNQEREREEREREERDARDASRDGVTPAPGAVAKLVERAIKAINDGRAAVASEFALDPGRAHGVFGGVAETEFVKRLLAVPLEHREELVDHAIAVLAAEARAAAAAGRRDALNNFRLASISSEKGWRYVCEQTLEGTAEQSTYRAHARSAAAQPKSRGRANGKYSAVPANPDDLEHAVHE